MSSHLGYDFRKSTRAWSVLLYLGGLACVVAFSAAPWAVPGMPCDLYIHCTGHDFATLQCMAADNQDANVQQLQADLLEEHHPQRQLTSTASCNRDTLKEWQKQGSELP